ncbi:MAG: DNA-binding transcriptional regulator [Pirellulales bacterium]|nr:DNA-binding transcriptional regulator [Pirellulales bacterium]
MNRTPRVALLMESSRAYERGLIRGIAKYSTLNGPWNFYRKVPSVTGGHQQAIRALRNWKPDGIILREQKNMRAILDLGLPVVISPSERNILGYSNIRTNDKEIGRLGAEHLIDRGLRHFAYCGMDDIFVWSKGRRDSFCTSISHGGYDVHCYDPPYKARQFTWSRERKHIVAWLGGLPKPLGLMVCSDDHCLCVIEACALADYRIPDDVAIVSVGNDEMICELSFPPLSSIALGSSRGGYVAAENLARQMAGQGEIQDIVIEPTGVACRGSSDIMAVDDQEIAQAIRFIQQNSGRPISVDDVVRATALSRRNLYARFSQATGRGVSQYIRSLRAARAARLLLETGMSVSQVSAALGFADEKNFARFFRREKGMNPAEYRNHKGFS